MTAFDRWNKCGQKMKKSKSWSLANGVEKKPYLLQKMKDIMEVQK